MRLIAFPFLLWRLPAWLGGKYTNRHGDWDDTFDTIQSLRERKPPITDPIADLSQGNKLSPRVCH